jgi:phenylalanyl-tRNA synthetase beta chain
MRSALAALELSITREAEPPVMEGGSPTWTVSIPSWRDDLDRPIDLVEEVLRVYGTERIPAAPVLAPSLIAEDDPIVQFNRRVAEYLVGQRFNECVNYTLRSAKELQTWVSQTAAAELALANPFVEDQSHLRASLITGLLDSLKLNRSRGVAATRLFETGRVFVERNGQNYECVAVGFVIAEDPSRREWLPREADDFYSVKRHVETLASAAGIDLARQPLSPITDPFYGWQPGHSAVAGDMQHGWSARFGLLSLPMVKAYGLDGKVYAGILAVLPEKITDDSSHGRFQPFSLFPAALRDLALVVDEGVAAAEVQKSLAKIARAAVNNAFNLESIGVFDVYRGKGLPEGKKSLAFSLVFRAQERTLTDDEVNAVFQKIQDEVSSTTTYQIRK